MKTLDELQALIGKAPWLSGTQASDLVAERVSRSDMTEDQAIDDAFESITDMLAGSDRTD